jgi:hypothetical protein
MTDTIAVVAADQEEPVTAGAPPTPVDEDQVAQQLLAQAKAQGVELVGPNGLLNQLTKRVLETALEEEMSAHLGYQKHDPLGRDRGNSRIGVRAKTVLTEIGPVEIEVPRDTDASFQPQIAEVAAAPADRGRRDRVVVDRARVDDRGDLGAQRPRSTVPRSRRTPSPRSPTRWSRR